MSFVDNEEIKTALVAKLKSIATITAEVPATEIREFQYQGDTFAYPNIRVRILENTPIGNTGCHHRVQVGIMVHSEEKSSKESEHISGIIGEALNDISFSQSGIFFFLRLTNLVPALRIDERTWRSEALLTATVS